MRGKAGTSRKKQLRETAQVEKQRRKARSATRKGQADAAQKASEQASPSPSGPASSAKA